MAGNKKNMQDLQDSFQNSGGANDPLVQAAGKAWSYLTGGANDSSKSDSDADDQDAINKKQGSQGY